MHNQTESGFDYSSSVAKSYANNRRALSDVLQELISEAALHPESRVLEVGCGTGNYIRSICDATGCKCWGMDPSEEMLAVARTGGEGPRFRQGAGEALPFPDREFDLAFSVDVIHHVLAANRPEFYKEAFRVLRPGGMICTVTESEEMIRKRHPLATYFPDTVESQLRVYPGVKDMREMMAEAGFDEIRETALVTTYEIRDSRVYREKALSCLHAIPLESYQEGLRRIEADLRNGPIAGRWQNLMLWGKKTEAGVEG